MQCFKYRPTDRPDVQRYDYSSDVCEVGMPFAVDPVDLIQEVVVSPYAESWMLDLVRSVCKRHGMANPVRTSDMKKEPGW